MNLFTLVDYLDQLLKTETISDYPQAHNGLQLANSGKIRRVAVAVDACTAVIEKAIEAQADLLIVHHGLFWGGEQKITGPFYHKLRKAMDHNLSIYSSHLPLDFHSKVGNNILLAQALGLKEITSALKIKGEPLGLRGLLTPLPRPLFLERVATAVNGPVHLAPGGPEIIHRVLVVTGGAGSEVAAAAKEGVDTFVTGEGPHWSYTMAEELGVNLIYAGHYATETFGVKALGALLEEEFDLPWSFLHHPTGL